MTKLKINRIFAFIFIALSLIKVVYSLIFMHTEDPIEHVYHYIENGVHIVLLVFLTKQAIKNKIGHFFHEYFLEAIIMGIMSTIGLVYTCIAHHYTLDDSFITLLPVVLSIAVNVFLLVSFEHHHDHTVKTVLVVFVALSLLLNTTSVVDNIITFALGEMESKEFVTIVISNLLSLLFNIFVLLTAVSMKHVLRNNPNQVVDYVKLEEDENEKKA